MATVALMRKFYLMHEYFAHTSQSIDKWSSFTVDEYKNCPPTQAHATHNHVNVPISVKTTEINLIYFNNPNDVWVHWLQYIKL